MTRAATPEAALRAAIALYKRAARDVANPVMWEECRQQAERALCILEAWKEGAAYRLMAADPELSWIADSLISSGRYGELGDW